MQGFVRGGALRLSGFEVRLRGLAEGMVIYGVEVVTGRRADL